MSTASVVETNERTNRWLRRLAVVALLLFTALLVLTVVLGAFTAARVVKAIDQGRRSGQILVDCTTPTPAATADDPTPRKHECFERGARGTSGAIGEIDCRDRRALAGLPPPEDPLLPCASQTPAEVYPPPREP